MNKTFDWTKGNAASEEEFERRLLLGFDILLNYPLPECAILATGSTQVEEADGTDRGTRLHSRVIDRTGEGLES